MNIKLLSIVILSSFSLCHLANAGIIDAGDVLFKNTVQYSKSSKGPGFTNVGLEVISKLPKRVYLAIKNGESIWKSEDDKYVTFVEPVKKGLLTSKTFPKKFEIDIDEPTSLAVWYTDPGVVKYGKSGPFGLIGDKEFSPAPDEIVTFDTGKTLYLTVDPKGFRPQSGPLKGFLEVTDSNLALGKNIKPEGITSRKLKSADTKPAQAKEATGQFVKA